MLQIGVTADVFGAPIGELAREHQAEPVAKRHTRGFAAQFDSARGCQIGNLHFAGCFGKALRDQRDTVAALVFDRDDLADEVSVRVPGLKDEAAVPFRNVPVLPDEREGFFAGIE